jgi:acetyl esterase/lipase
MPRTTSASVPSPCPSRRGERADGSGAATLVPTETVVYEVPGMDDVDVRADLVYKEVEGLDLRFDVYTARSAVRATPVVVFVHGDGPPEVLADAKDWGQYTSWGRLVAASGLAGVTFNHRSTLGATELEAAAGDVDDLISHVRAHGAELGLDPERLCIWTCSAGGPIGMRVALGGQAYVRCAVCFYGMLDLRHLRDQISDEVGDDVLEEFSPVRHLARDGREIPPLLVARAGRDRPVFNEAIDRFVSEAVQRGATVDLLTHPGGQHGFDVLDDDDRSREIIARTLAFMRRHLQAD